MKSRVYMIMHEVNENKGGGTAAMLARTKLFNENDIESHIVTFNYNLEYKGMKNRFISADRMSDKAEILNIYNYYRDKNLKNDNSCKETRNCVEGNLDKFHSKKGIQYFKSGVLVKCEKYDDGGEMISEEFYDKNGRIDVINEFHCGFRHREVKYNNGKVTRERLFTDDEFCYITRYFCDDKLVNIYLFDRKNGVVDVFMNERELDAHWLEEICKQDVQNDVQPRILIDGQGSLPRALKVPENLAKKYYILHTNHFKPPYKVGAQIMPPYDYVFNHIEELDGFIVLTEKQKKDIEIQFGKQDNIFVIPNYLKIYDTLNIKKDPLKVTLFGRLVKQKAIHRAIEMFQYVVEKEPKAILEIFGDGKEKESLRGEIKKLNLEKSVFLKGHSQNVHREMQESITTVLTSISEGFGLVVVESLLNQTPVVSLDCNYGPSDIITNKEDGYIEKDLKELASKIVYLIRNSDIAKEMGKNGRRNMLEKYSSDLIYQKWQCLFNRK